MSFRSRPTDLKQLQQLLSGSGLTRRTLLAISSIQDLLQAEAVKRQREAASTQRRMQLLGCLLRVFRFCSMRCALIHIYHFELECHLQAVHDAPSSVWQ